MGRILAIDYGSKRVGLAVSDPLRMIASGLTAVHSKDVIEYMENYFKKEGVDIIVVGEPKTLMNKKSDSARFVPIKKLCASTSVLPAPLLTKPCLWVA
jgi:putative holliday junction resolvase